MDLLPDLNDLEIVAPEEIERVMIAGEVVKENNAETTEEPLIDKHDEVFKTVQAHPPPRIGKTYNNIAHLDKIRAKSVEARWGKKEEREEKKKKKEAEKERNKELKRIKREAKAEENREKARQRYWNKKAEKELREKEVIKGEVSIVPIPPAVKHHLQRDAPAPVALAAGLSYNQFATYMDNYNQQRPKKQSPLVPPKEKIIYKEKIVYKEPVIKKASYPSIFSHIDF
tara:strand:- start:324 stop:1007 length:684 start_codon:yes stop_codon:yes gene_type:complete